jgi:hypothetical protein
MDSIRKDITKAIDEGEKTLRNNQLTIFCGVGNEIILD